MSKPGSLTGTEIEQHLAPIEEDVSQEHSRYMTGDIDQDNSSKKKANNSGSGASGGGGGAMANIFDATAA